MSSTTLRRYMISLTSIFCVIYPEILGVSMDEIPIKDSSILPLRFVKIGLDYKNVDKGLDLTEEQMKKFKIWPRGIIPYFIDDYSFDKVLRDKIRLFLEGTSAQTGLQFVELPNPPEDDEVRWVFFINRRGQLECADCTTANFTNNGVQRVVLGYDCLGVGSGALAATVLALAGVPPQHNAPDRDDYIKITEENILPDKKRFFNILSADDWLFPDSEYDFASAGHYDFYKYTSNGQITIKPKLRVNFPVGDATGFSPGDIYKIKKLYKYISQKEKPDMSEDCSKLFKPGKKIEQIKLEEALSKSTSVDNNNANNTGKNLKVRLKGSFANKVRNERNKIQTELDFDTDVDNGTYNI